MDTAAILSIFVAACAASVALMFFARRAKQRAMSVDGRVIEHLRLAGSDLTRPHSVEFFFYFPTQDAANRVAAQLGQFGLTSRVERAEHGDEWAVLATKSMVPTDVAMTELRAAFAPLSAAEGGTYDGWGSSTVR